MTNRRSDVFFTGRNLLLGTLIPEWEKVKGHLEGSREQGPNYVPGGTMNQQVFRHIRMLEHPSAQNSRHLMLHILVALSCGVLGVMTTWTLLCMDH